MSILCPAKEVESDHDGHMTVTFRSGDLFDTELTHLGHGVNVVGVMGAGIAVSFRERYPEMYEDYQEACRENRIQPGSVFPYSEGGDRIYNIASQDKPGAHARLEWLRSGLDAALAVVAEYGGEGIAIPRIGCGIGGLDWDNVLPIIEELSDKHDVTVEVWTL